MAEDTSKTAPSAEAGAEGAPTEGADAGAAKKKKLLMLVSAAVAVVGVIVAVGVIFLFKGEEKTGEEAEAKPTEIAKLAVYDVPEFTLNLLTDEQTGGPRFMKMILAVELANEADTQNMEKLLPRLQDDWGGFLRQLRPADLQGSAALQRLKEGLLRRANQSLEPVEVKAVYIRELLVQ
jgi:flagellar FliL protein